MLVGQFNLQKIVNHLLLNLQWLSFFSRSFQIFASFSSSHQEGLAIKKRAFFNHIL
jgi:hypothetical protein